MDQIPEISDKEKLRICSDYILHSPPGEVTEVFNDVRLLLGNDPLLRDGCAAAFSTYNKDQFQPVELGEGRPKSLVTRYNEISDSRFYCPKSSVSFAYDHLRREASDIQSYKDGNETKAEPFRVALQQAANAYLENHFGANGVCTVFGGLEKSSNLPQLTLCIESHGFQPKNYWNGRWRSQWAVVLSSKEAELKGLIKVQVHYYEDGNVQLVSSKEISSQIQSSNDPHAVAKEIIRVIEEQETAYQSAVHENYQTMSDTTFKALRRPLPITKTKFDWSKVQAYQARDEMVKTSQS